MRLNLFIVFIMLFWFFRPPSPPTELCSNILVFRELYKNWHDFLGAEFVPERLQFRRQLSMLRWRIAIYENRSYRLPSQR